MSRLANVHVRAYRGLQDVGMKGLQDINVLIGPTNTGKSSMLEVIWLATGPNRLIASLRQSSGGEVWMEYLLSKPFSLDSNRRAI